MGRQSKSRLSGIAALDNDALRAKTEELKAYIRNSAAEQRSKVEELKASVENTELEEREELFAQIDKLEKGDTGYLRKSIGRGAARCFLPS